MTATFDVLTLHFRESGNFPNNPVLPALFYQQVVPADRRGGAESIAAYFESAWPKHGWRADWRWGVYDFPHFHSTAHEVLGVYRGQASLRVGHDVGATITVTAGDMLVLPAGMTHQNLGSSADFGVVGGYPQGQTADLQRGEPRERDAAIERIRHVPLPRADPISGGNGPLVAAWLRK